MRTSFMMKRRKVWGLRSFSLLLLLAALALPGLAQTTVALAQTGRARTPSETVRQFYTALKEKRFRDALIISIYRPAIEGLTAAELEELRPDFEKMAAGAEKVEVKGEQLSGETATVFVRMTDDPAEAPPAPVPLLKVDGQWIVGERSDYELVKKGGKDFFFTTRIEVHEGDVREMLQRIQLAQLAYSAQHNGAFADLPALINAGLVPKDLEGTESTGYRFTVRVAKDGKSYSVTAEPARYNRTGRLSFYLDQTGIRSADVGGKPLDVAIQKP